MPDVEDGGGGWEPGFSDVTVAGTGARRCGRAADVLASWVAVLEDGAADLVDTSTIESEAAAIGNYF